MTHLRPRCQMCHAVNPRKHRKVDPGSRSWQYRYALLCTTCGRRHGFEEVPYERLMWGPQGAVRIP